jgi:hypothetical protein
MQVIVVVILLTSSFCHCSRNCNSGALITGKHDANVQKETNAGKKDHENEAGAQKGISEAGTEDEDAVGEDDAVSGKDVV